MTTTADAPEPTPAPERPPATLGATPVPKTAQRRSWTPTKRSMPTTSG